MIRDPHRLQVTMEQMERLLRALEDLRETILPQDPKLFALLAEAPLGDLARWLARPSPLCSSQSMTTSTNDTDWAADS